MNNSISKIFLDSVKICKHEFLSSRILLIITIIISVFNLLIMISKENNIVYALLILMQIFTFSIFFITYVLTAAISFYHGVFGKYAYFTHSLPIHLDSIIISKIFVFLLWAFIGILEFGLLFVVTKTYDNLLNRLNVITNLDTLEYMLIFLILTLSELIYIFMITAIIHRKKTYTLLFGILTYFGIKILLMIIFALISSLFNDIAIEYNNGKTMFYLVNIFLTILYYSICRYIIKNKLSL